LDQLERNFLVEVERLKHDILGQLRVDDDKYYNIDNEVNTSFTHHPTASPSTSYTSPSSSPSTSLHASQNEVNEGFASLEDNSLHQSATSVDTSSFTSAAASPSSFISQLTASRPATSPVPPSTGAGEGDGRQVGKSRRVAPERQAAAHVVRVRATYKFDAHEEDELSLPKGLELIVFMREVPTALQSLKRLLDSLKPSCRTRAGCGASIPTGEWESSLPTSSLSWVRVVLLDLFSRPASHHMRLQRATSTTSPFARTMMKRRPTPTNNTNHLNPPLTSLHMTKPWPPSLTASTTAVAPSRRLLLGRSRSHAWAPSSASRR
jgi:hypothetical protein